MASTFSSTGSPFNRKSLKRPDRFLRTLVEAFRSISQNTARVFAVLGGLLALALFGAYFLNYSDSQAKSARNALFLAEKIVLSELKSIAESEKITPDAVTYKKLDVDLRMPESVKKMKKVEQEFSRTRAAFESRLKLGNLYFNHGEFVKALPWYQKAFDTAPNNFEKAVALLAQGNIQENLGKTTEAVEIYKKTIHLGEGTLKGDLLLALARSYEALNNFAQAGSTYDQILTDLPKTEYAKSAEIFKKQLH